jgi:hypothetical protein
MNHKHEQLEKVNDEKECIIEDSLTEMAEGLLITIASA